MEWHRARLGQNVGETFGYEKGSCCDPDGMGGRIRPQEQFVVGDGVLVLVVACMCLLVGLVGEGMHCAGTCQTRTSQRDHAARERSLGDH